MARGMGEQALLTIAYSIHRCVYRRSGHLQGWLQHEPKMTRQLSECEELHQRWASCTAGESCVVVASYRNPSPSAVMALASARHLRRRLSDQSPTVDPKHNKVSAVSINNPANSCYGSPHEL